MSSLIEIIRSNKIKSLSIVDQLVLLLTWPHHSMKSIMMLRMTLQSISLKVRELNSSLRMKKREIEPTPVAHLKNSLNKENLLKNGCLWRL